MIMKISGGQFLTVNFFLSVTYFPVKVPYILQIEQAAAGGGGREKFSVQQIVWGCEVFWYRTPQTRFVNVGDPYTVKKKM